MVAISWFLAIGMACYLGSMLYTLVLASFLGDDGPDVSGTGSGDYSTDETVINHGRSTGAAT